VANILQLQYGLLMGLDSDAGGCRVRDRAGQRGHWQEETWPGILKSL
jgi:hypothetical protein